MATTYTPNAALRKPGTADRNWDVPINANADALDAMTALGALAVTQAEYPSTTRGIVISAGRFRKADGTVATFAGGTATAQASATTRYWLTDSGALTSGANFPTTAHVPLASVVAAGGVITSISDERVQCGTVGTPLPDGTNIALGTTIGTKIGTATTQKLAFYNSTPIVKPTVTGSRGGNAALASLLTQLAALGLIVDSSS